VFDLENNQRVRQAQADLNNLIGRSYTILSERTYMRPSLPLLLARLATKERPISVKLASLAAGSVVFLLLFPAAFFLIARILAPYCCSFGLPRGIEIVLALTLIGGGLLLIAWAAFAQWTVGRGTPAQTAPTQALVTTGPYALCRNPIELGAVLYYFGVGTLFGSLFHGLVGFILGLLVGSFYHSKIEEQELEQRFGAAYIAYRQRTPFLLPRLWRSRKKS
jgi:protein-S-isoprenylcysteine O-methyltransferase Ste14